MTPRTLLGWVASSFLCACLAGCAPAPPVAGGTETVKGAARGGGAVIGYLVTKDRMITIFSDGPRFSIETLDGRPIEGPLTIDGLQASDPSAASIFRNGIVGHGDLLDASLWSPMEPDGDGIEVPGPGPARRIVK